MSCAKSWLLIGHTQSAIGSQLPVMLNHPAMSGWAKYINKLLALTKWPCLSPLSVELHVWKCGYGGTYIMKHKVCVFDMLSAILVDCNHLPKSVVLM